MGFGRRLVSNGARVARRLATSQVLVDAPGHWLDVRIADDLPERSLDGFGRPELGLLDLLRCLDAVREDARFDGVLLRISGSLGSFGRAASVARALRAVQDAGRRVVVWAEGLTAEHLCMVSSADLLLMPESGQVHLVGLSIERFFVRGLLEQIGAKPDVVHIGRYKSAGETFTRDTMSDTEREQLDAWQEDVFGDLVASIGRGRDLSEDRVRELIDGGPYPARVAIDVGLIDALAYPDELDRHLGDVSLGLDATNREARRPRRVDAVAYHLGFAGDAGYESLWRDRPRLVQLLAVGNVSRGTSPRAITSEGTGAVLEALRTSASVRGVLLRVESGGGDALASDLLHRQVERLTREKPVVVSMGDVVASGGYYIAAAADSIHAEGATLTGSIGVVGGKLDLSGLYEKLGVAKDGVQRGKRAGLLSESRGFSADERAAIRREMQAIYGTFVDRVARGRRLEHEKVEDIAGGRVWSGHRAEALGLVDGIGGPLEALRDLMARAGLGPSERFPLVTLPRASWVSTWLSSALGGFGPFGSRR